MSLLLLLYRSSRPHVAELGHVAGTAGQYADIERHPENVAVDGIPVLRVEAGLYFANADAVRRAVKRHARRSATRGVVLDAEAVAFIDVTAVRMLDELASDIGREGQRLVIAHDVGQVERPARHSRPRRHGHHGRADDRRGGRCHPSVAVVATVTDGQARRH